MTRGLLTSRSSQLAAAALRRFVDDSEPLTGDLLEEFNAGRTRLWLWWQVLAAILLEARRTPSDIRPLRLLDDTSWRPIARPTLAPAARTINLAASPTASAGGLSVVVLGTLVALVNPAIWWAFLYTSLAGVLLGAGMVLWRRRRVRDKTDNSTPSVLLPRM